MSARDLIHQALSDGLRLHLSDAGKLRYAGPEDAVGRWLPTIRENMSAIIEALTPPLDTPVRHWLLHYRNRQPVEIFCSPPATQKELLQDNPDAIAAEPIPGFDQSTESF